MTFRRPIASTQHAFIVLSAIVFILSSVVSSTIYIESSYIRDAILHTEALVGLTADPDRLVGIAYTLASLVTLYALITAPRRLRRFGDYRFTLSLMMLLVLVLFGLALGGSAFLVIPLFIIQTTLVSILFYNLDLFLEHYARSENMGVIRGRYATMSALAFLLPPLAAGLLVERFGFELVYLIAAFLLFPALFLLVRYLSDFKDLEYEHVALLEPLSVFRTQPDLGRISLARFFLHFFYVWMIVYTPLYFHNHLGIGYGQIGLMLTIALTTFVLIPSPAGWLADKVLGEKELIVLGFILMGSASFAIPFAATSLHPVLFLGALLFLGRTGAALVDTLTDVYFFKEVDGKSASLISYYRSISPLASMIAPLLASILLFGHTIELSGLFTILGVIMLCATYFPLRIKDTL
jgi:MFS family permease